MQGLNLSFVQLETDYYGYRLDNGTYFGGLEEMIDGRFDIPTTYNGIIEHHFDDYLHLTVFGTTPFGILMRRRQSFVGINTDGLMAGIKWDVYCVFVVLIVCLTFVACVNEKRQSDRNSLWQILNTQMPGNTSTFTYQNGFTRRLILLTCGIIVFLSTAYYESNLLQMLLIPQRPEEITVSEVAQHIAQRKSNVYAFIETQNAINYGKDPAGLQRALTLNPPIAVLSSLDLQLNIVRDNGVVIDEIALLHQRLSKLPPNKCSNYAIVELDDAESFVITTILRNERRDMLDALNVIVSERVEYVTKLIAQLEMTDECRQHIYPPHTASPAYVALNMYTISGAFALLVCLLGVAFVVFITEVLIGRVIGQGGKVHPTEQLETVLHTFEQCTLPTVLSHINTDDEDSVVDKYMEFRAFLLQRQKQHS
jgi:hypothetical protein